MKEPRDIIADAVAPGSALDTSPDGAEKRVWAEAIADGVVEMLKQSGYEIVRTAKDDR